MRKSSKRSKSRDRPPFCYYCGFCSTVKEMIYTGKKSQAKGRRGEIELAGILQEYGYNVKPADPLNYGTIPDLTGLPGVHIECKRCEQLRLSEWMAQAERDAQRFQDGAPTIFHRKSRSPWLVTMRLVDWLNLYERAEGD